MKSIRANAAANGPATKPACGLRMAGLRRFPYAESLALCYEDTSLSHDLEFLCDPRVNISDRVLMNVVAKYFFAYVHESSHDQSIALDDICGLFHLYDRHMSLNEPSDDIEVMNSLRRWSLALDILVNASRTASMLRSVAMQKPHPEFKRNNYVGLDLRTGSGILALGAYVQARRNGFEDIEIIGLESDAEVGKRTGELLGMLCPGRVILGDALNPATYESIRDKDVAFVSLDAVSPGSRPLERGFHSGMFKALFHSAGSRLDRAVFFPDGMIVYSRELNISLILSKENGFQLPGEYKGSEFYTQGLFIDGRVVPLHRLGSDFLSDF